MLAMALDWKKIVDNEWTYIPLVFVTCLWSFGIGLLIGWLMVQ
jgi:hypothetical protein